MPAIRNSERSWLRLLRRRSVAAITFALALMLLVVALAVYFAPRLGLEEEDFH